MPYHKSKVGKNEIRKGFDLIVMNLCHILNQNGNERGLVKRELGICIMNDKRKTIKRCGIVLIVLVLFVVISIVSQLVAHWTCGLLKQLL